jgi:hypothetical protein
MEDWIWRLELDGGAVIGQDLETNANKFELPQKSYRSGWT